MTLNYQCEIQSVDDGGYHTTWLPERAAKKGATIQLTEDQNWYVVRKVYTKAALTNSQLKTAADQARNTRKASDI